ncbi:hypothetical protein GCM10027598_72390 [Amycolatopsis oliviviridis]|uniref:Uncharacterized protein n=1 Tax=Amycolatopsis oliviviridis TaxID=1471590 RepID=A0ABQ3L438_9PSEU|nr:hypothetical protein GCM10017790_02330 [Amycolatopsis oliviviridis]
MPEKTSRIAGRLGAMIAAAMIVSGAAASTVPRARRVGAEVSARFVTPPISQRGPGLRVGENRLCPKWPDKHW